MFGNSSSSNKGILGGSNSSGSSITNAIPGFQEEPACAQYCPKLTYKQRLIGFFGCAALGWVLSLVGTLTLVGGMTDENIRIFVILYVIGNVIALCATGFLLGPRSQCRKMWAPTRRYTTAFYLLMLIIVLTVALLRQNVLLILFLLFIEILAALWYSISFIPFGRKIVCKFFRSTGACMPCFYVYDSTKEVYDNNTKPESTSSKMTSFFSGGGNKGSNDNSNQV